VVLVVRDPVGPGQRRRVRDVVVAPRLGVVHARVERDGGEAGDDEDEDGDDGDHLTPFAAAPKSALHPDVHQLLFPVSHGCPGHAAVRGPDWDHLAGFPPVPHLSALLGLILDLGLVRHRGASLSD
jgi:hypothetical protein